MSDPSSRPGAGPSAPTADDECLLTLENLGRIPGIVHAFELRDGDLRSVLPEPLVRLEQVHGAAVHRIDEGLPPTSPYLRVDPLRRPAGDGLVTARAGSTLAVAVADCLPVLMADGDGRAVAAVHAGWRGIVAGVLAEAVRSLESAYGIPPSRMAVGFGPAIGSCCYEVGGDVVRAFLRAGLAEAAFHDTPIAGGRRVSCDLEAAAREQLRRSGVDLDRVAAVGICTACEPQRAWSYRVQGDRAGRMLAGIARSPD